jgi:MerR family transcriptional regulator, light-induced transcriptional regulator
LATASNIDFAAMCDRYVETQLGGDRRAALQFIDEALREGVPADDVRHHVVQAAQREIGRLWQEDRISIAQEHMATAISQLALAHLFQHATFHARVGRKILIACVPGEHHDFPTRLLADALDVAGYDVRFLGADVPLDSLLRAVDTEKPDLVALSVTMVFNVPSLREAVRMVRARSGQPVPIAIGGSVFSTSLDLAEGIDVELVAGDSQAFIQQLDRFFGERP